jgi:GT2 family glycosyltransferase
MMLPSVNIVIPTWDGLHLLKKSLDSVLAASKRYDGLCYISIVDNGSMDRTIDVIKDYYPEINLIGNKVNLGFGAACNIGARSVESDLVLFLNNDVFIKENFISQIVAESFKIPNFFSICPQTNYWSDNNLTNKVFSSSINFSLTDKQELIQHWAVKDFINLADEMELTIYGTGAVLLVNRNKFISLNGFDEIYGLAYWEDVDLCLRAWKRGWASFCTAKVIAWHMISATSQNQNYDSKTFLMKKNYIIFQIIHLPRIRKKIKFLFYVTNKKYSLSKYLVGSIIPIIKRIFIDKACSSYTIDQIIARIGVKNESWSSSEIL